MRHDLEQFLREYIEAVQVSEGRLFRTAYLKTKTLTKNAMTGIDICRMMKRRLKSAGLPGHFSPHSFRSDDGDRSFGAERAARGRAVPGGAF